MTDKPDWATARALMYVNEIAAVMRGIQRKAKADGLRHAAAMYSEKYGDDEGIPDWFRLVADDIEQGGRQ